MRPSRGATPAGPCLVAGLVAALVVGCAAPRIVPVPAVGVQVDAAQGSASVAAEGVELVVRPSAWRGSPWDLRDYVTPFLVGLANGAAGPLQYDYSGLRLYDDARFQYTALPPAEVERILRWGSAADVRLAAAVKSPPPILRRRVVPDHFGDWWWDRYGWYGWYGGHDWYGGYGWYGGHDWYGGYGWYGWPWYYPGSPFFADVHLRALPMGVLQPGARLEGFVYFPRLRGDARGLTLEFHHRLGDVPRVLTLPFQVERDAGGGAGA